MDAEKLTKEEYIREFPLEEDDVLKAIGNIIAEYYEHSEKYTDIQIAELRAELSALLYSASCGFIKDLSLARIGTFSRREEAEARAYKRAFNAAFTGADDEGQECPKMSLSVAVSHARKMFKLDPEYLATLEECDRLDHNYWVMKTITNQANEVLNSMGARNKVAY